MVRLSPRKSVRSPQWTRGALVLAGALAILLVSVIVPPAASAGTKHSSSHGSKTTGSASGSGPKWKLVTISDTNALYTLSCPTTKLCVALDTDGNAVISTNPTGGASSWKATDIDGTTGGYSIACPTVKLCVAVDGSGNAIVSTNPTGGTAAWSVAEVDTVFYNSLYGVSCPTVTLCVAVDTSGDAVFSTNPTGGASAWTTTANIDPEPPGGNPDANSIDAVSCPSITLCVAGDSSGNVLTTTDPTGPASGWTVTEVEPNGSLGPVHCASVHLCVAVGHADVWTSTNPTGGAAAWKKTNFPVPFADADCQSAHACAAEDVATDVYATSNFRGATKTWKEDGIGATSNHLSGGVDCPGPHLCIAVGLDNVLTTTDP
jgi:hypothetical protein